MADHQFIRDRGNVKWSSMMLPEHREVLNRLENSIHDVAEPMFDKDKLAELSEVISRVIYEKSVVFIEYYKDKQLHSLLGIIEKYDVSSKTIKVKALDKEIQIPVKYIIGVQEDQQNADLQR